MSVQLDTFLSFHMWDAAFGAYKEKASGSGSSYHTSQSDVRTSEYVFIPRMWDAAFGAYKEKASGRWSSYYTSRSDVRTSEYVFIPRMWDAPLARIRRNHRKLVFKSYIAKRCPYK